MTPRGRPPPSPSSCSRRPRRRSAAPTTRSTEVEADLRRCRPRAHRLVRRRRHPGRLRLGGPVRADQQDRGRRLRASRARRALGDEVLATLEAARPSSSPRRPATTTRCFDIGAYREDERTRGWLAARGFEIGDHVHPDAHRLRPARRRHPSRPPASSYAGPTPPTHDLRLALDIARGGVHRALRARAADVRRVPRAVRTSTATDWSSLWMAELDGQPVRPARSAPQQFARRRTRATCARSASCRGGARHGFAKALLQTSFAAVAERRPTAPCCCTSTRERDQRARALRVGGHARRCCRSTPGPDTSATDRLTALG